MRSLGAPVIVVLAFAPIGLSNDSTGEMTGSLFYVLLISLLLSWFTAISLTPFFANLMFKETISGGASEANDPYRGIFLLSIESSSSGGGILASLSAFAMTRLGYDDVAVSTASLQEWAADRSNPMEIDTH